MCEPDTVRIEGIVITNSDHTANADLPRNRWRSSERRAGSNTSYLRTYRSYQNSSCHTADRRPNGAATSSRAILILPRWALGEDSDGGTSVEYSAFPWPYNYARLWNGTGINWIGDLLFHRTQGHHRNQQSANEEK